MLRRALPLVLVTGVITLSVLELANAQTPAGPQATAPQVYRPGLGDLMTMTVQPRHTKLGLAGQEKNWAYAAYELHELEESFERAAQAWPIYRKTNIAETILATTKSRSRQRCAEIRRSSPSLPIISRTASTWP